MKITIKNLQKKIPINPKRIKKTILRALTSEGAAGKSLGEITICFVSDERIKAFNLKYRHKDSPTDVLAFQMPKQGNSGYRLLDIIISADTALRNARIFKTKPIDELNLYAVHGLLHLLGYDDSGARERRLMRQKEREYVHTQD